MTERAFNYAASPQLVVDPYADTILLANQESCRFLRMDVDEIRQQKASYFFSPSLPEFIVFSDELTERGRGWADHLMIKSNGEDRRVEIVGRYTAAGDERHLYLSFLPLDDLDSLREKSSAQKHYLSGIGHWNRVTQVFQEFERENQLLLDAAGEGIYGVDSNGLTTFVNPAAERILGYSALELAGKNMHSTVHYSHGNGSHFHVSECPIFEAFRDGAVHHVQDDVFWNKSGRAVDVEYTSTPIRDNGFIVGAVVIFRDVSQRKVNEKKLVKALEEVEQLKNRLELENAYLHEEINSEFNHHKIIGNSQAINNIIEQINLVAPTEASVLISGESGTGKELIARAIHDTSKRNQRSLIRVNCAAIPEDLFESEFFGHTKGAFTGATSDRPGRFELADGGTLFLDEVGEIPLHLQGKLLRVLQEQQFEKVGGSKTTHVDVRIVAATNRDLRAEVNRGAFREDLYFRLNVFPLESVSLRERVDDIPLLTQHFLLRACKKSNKPDLRIPLSEVEKLKKYDWPGNIRELENIIERQVILARDNTIRFSNIFESENSLVMKPKGVSEKSIFTASERKEQDRRNILLALEECEGKVFGKLGAAELLGLKPTTLASRIKKYAIDTRIFKP